MSVLGTYLTFDGRCRAAFERYADLLGGTVTMVVTHGDAPPDAFPPDTSFPEGWDEAVLHAELDIGGRLLYGSDRPADWYQPMQGCAVSLNVETGAEAERIFTELADRGRVDMPIAPTFYAERFGMVTDQYGISWMVGGGAPPSGAAS